MPTNKRQREPTPPGTKSFPFREPKEGTRWKALLDAMGYHPDHSNLFDCYSYLNERCAEKIEENVRRRCIAEGYDPDHPYLATLLASHALFLMDANTRRLEEEYLQQSARRPGAPQNNEYLEIVAFAVVCHEQRNAAQEGRAFRLADVARKLALHPDTLSRAYRKVAFDFVRNVSALGTPPDVQELAARLWSRVTEEVGAHWPKIAARKNYRN